MKLYTCLKDGEFIKSPLPGGYAGWWPGKIFGRLDCKSGMKMKKENRVFFHTLEDAVNEGYRPCKKCRPIDETDFFRIQHLVPMYLNVEEFYNRDNELKSE
ncbi:MAG: Ada metal-binding domain-containing protein [Nanoarchaeota archaeon]|nr:Ada metal-binding domain-containing protein [Nanoarchaeota archaeon]